MATLFERLIGQNLNDADPPEGQKIAIHAFSAIVHEFARGKVTGAEAKAMFNLTNDQTTDAQTFFSLLGAAPDKQRFMRVFKDWLYLGEVEADARYLSAANLLQRMQDEVIDQGGTLP